MHGRTLGAAVAAVVMLMVAVPATAFAGTANAGLSGASATNPLVAPQSEMPWGVYKGGIDGTWTAYADASGSNKQLLAKIATEPLAYWFGTWDTNAQATEDVETYISKATDGNPNALVQMAIFRLTPWEGAACSSLPTAADQASYKAWVNHWAFGIGNTRTALILQPDLGYEYCVPHTSKIPTNLVAYAAKKFTALPYTTVYIDAGASDWMTPSQAASLLVWAGVRYTRGFALNATHFTSTASNIQYGQEVVNQLARDGVPNMHFVINTAQNGKPFKWNMYHGNDPTCHSRAQNNCVTLGIPPTTNVASPQWHLGKWAKVARKLVDAYLWFGRPWLDNQGGPFNLGAALDMAATTPY